MSTGVKKSLLVLAGVLVGGLPVAFPVLAPFQELFFTAGAFLTGGAVLRRPGDAKVRP